MESFHFVKAFKKQMNKVFHGHAQPVVRYRQIWEQLQESIEGPKGKRNTQKLKIPKNMSEVRKSLKILIELIVNEMKDKHYAQLEGRTFYTRGDSMAPPCYEYILENEVIKTLCRWAKEPGLDLIMIHHLLDILMFVSPKLLSHYKQATEPLIDLLQHTESRLQLWAATDNKDVNHTHHTRCLSHGFIQLLLCIANKLSDVAAVGPVQFFFVDVRKFQFCEELTANASEEKQILTLLDFAIPYLRRRNEVVAASEVDYTWDLTDADRTYQIYTSEIAVRVLSVVLGLQHALVTKYLDEKAQFISQLFCQNVQDLCLEILVTDEHSDDAYRTKDVLYENVQRRLDILKVVSVTPSCRASYVSDFLDAFQTKIVTEVFEKRLTEPKGEDDFVALIELAVFFIDGLPQDPFCSSLLDIILKEPMKTKLLKGIMCNDPELVFVTLRLFSVILKADPQRGLSELVVGFVNRSSEERSLEVTSDHVDVLFHPVLFTNKGIDHSSLQDAHSTHGTMKAFTSSKASSMDLSSTLTSPTTDENALVNQLPFLTIQRFTTLLDQPLNITISLLDLVTTMIHLNYPPLTYYLLAVKNDRFLTLVQALQSLRTVIDGVVQQLGNSEFRVRYEDMRRYMGVVKTMPGYEWQAPATEENKIIEAGVILEEWRRELKATLQAISDFELLDGLRIPPANSEAA